MLFLMCNWDWFGIVAELGDFTELSTYSVEGSSHLLATPSVHVQHIKSYSLLPHMLAIEHAQ